MGIIINLLVFYFGAIFGNLYFNLKKFILRNQNTEKETKKGAKKGKEKCNEKTGFLANIPIVSYFFNPKECKKCKENHALKKLVSEIIVGVIFILAFNSTNIMSMILNNGKEFSEMALLLKAGFLVSFPLTFGFIYLIGTVEKETKIIEPNIITFGVIIAAVQLLLKFAVNIPEVIYTKNDIIIAGVHIILLLIVYVVQMATAKKDPESKYVLDIVMIVFILTIYFGSAIMITTIILTILTIVIGYIFGAFTNTEYKENILVKNENGKLKTKKESAFINSPKYIPYSLIIGGISVFVVIMNNFLALANVLI